MLRFTSTPGVAFTMKFIPSSGQSSASFLKSITRSFWNMSLPVIRLFESPRPTPVFISKKRPLKKFLADKAEQITVIEIINANIFFIESLLIYFHRIFQSFFRGFYEPFVGHDT